MAKGRTRSDLRRQAFGGLALGLAVGLAVCLLITAGAFEALERLAADSLLRATSEPAAASDDIVLVAMDQGSVEHFEKTLDMSYPWPRSFYGEFVRFIQRGQPKGILFDMLFTGPDLDRDEVLGADSDRAFAQAIRASGNVVLGVSLRPADPTPAASLSTELVARMALGRESPLQLERFARVDPLAAPLVASGARFGFVNAVIDDDGVVRRVRLLARVGEQVVPSLTVAGLLGAGQAGGLRAGADGLFSGSRPIRLDQKGLAWIRFHGPGGGGPEGQGRTYRYIPIANLLHAATQLASGQEPIIDPGVFADKWVIIGSTSTALFDQKATPFSPEGNFPGMEIHAAVLDNLINGDFLWRAPGWAVWLLVLLVSAMVGLAGRLTHRIRINVLSALGIAAGAFALSLGAFLSSGLILDPVSVQVAIVLAFVATTYANFVQERRNRRQIRNIFQHYLDPRVVRGLIEAPESVKLGGERRACTVFFSDVAGFTSVAEGMQPEQLVELMNRLLGLLTEAIIRRGGFVDKYIGDAVMAVFGAPADLPDHAQAACLAALDCHQRLAELNAEAEQHGWPALSIRVGVNTGEMIVGNMGSVRRMNYTVMGDAVNLASRLEGANKQFGTANLVGPATREQAGEGLRFRELDLLRVKGKQEPVRIFELVGPADQVAPGVDELSERFAEGLAAYRARDWDRAIQVFSSLTERWPDDGPTRTYLDRCRTFQQAPPPADWDGVFVMTVK